MPNLMFLVHQYNKKKNAFLEHFSLLHISECNDININISLCWNRDCEHQFVPITFGIGSVVPKISPTNIQINKFYFLITLIKKNSCMRRCYIYSFNYAEWKAQESKSNGQKWTRKERNEMKFSCFYPFFCNFHFNAVFKSNIAQKRLRDNVVLTFGFILEQNIINILKNHSVL